MLSGCASAATSRWAPKPLRPALTRRSWPCPLLWIRPPAQAPGHAFLHRDPRGPRLHRPVTDAVGGAPGSVRPRGSSARDFSGGFAPFLPPPRTSRFHCLEQNSAVLRHEARHGAGIKVPLMARARNEALAGHSSFLAVSRGDTAPARLRSASAETGSASPSRGRSRAFLPASVFYHSLPSPGSP